MTREEIKSRIIELLAEIGFDSPMTEETHLQQELGMDSLDRVEVMIMVEKDFNIHIPDESVEGVVTLGKLVDQVEFIYN